MSLRRIGIVNAVGSSNSAIHKNGAPAERAFNLLLGVTGSVATVKLLDLVRALRAAFAAGKPQPADDGATCKWSVDIRIVMTENAKHFYKKADLIKHLNDSSAKLVEIYDDHDEWSMWTKMSDPVLHIELRKWADLMLIAPLDANTMAKLANGLCDNLLTCIVRAWDTAKPLIYCPAMNVHMYEHPITREQLSKLQSFGYTRIDCVEKRLACGDVGMGAMAPVDQIANKVFETLLQPTSRGSSNSLSIPLLNQVPTYPIISTNTNGSGRSILAPPTASSRSLMMKNHHHHSLISRSRPTTRSMVHSKQSRIERFTQQLREAKADKIHNRLQQNGIGNSIANKIRANSVISLQNLRASNNELMNDDISDDQESVVVANNNSTPNYEAALDFDPTNLLEQSMIIDDHPNNDFPIVSSPKFANPVQNNNNTNNLSFSLLDASQSKFDNVSPLFDTSKFLALCHNKERGCFTCTICKHDYKNRKSMARHLKEQHVQGNIYQCKLCGVSYKRREKLIKHNRERHPELIDHLRTNRIWNDD